MHYSFHHLQISFVLSSLVSEVIQYGDYMIDLSITIEKVRFGFGDGIMNSSEF